MLSKDLYGNIVFQIIEGCYVYEFYFSENGLKRLYCFDYRSRETIFDEIKSVYEEKVIHKWRFERVFKLLCYKSEGDELVAFFKYLDNDEEFKSIAKKVLYDCCHELAKQSMELTKAVIELGKEK